MKVYLSVPMIANRALARAEMVSRAIKDSGHEVTSPWVLGPVEKGSSGDVNVFERDKGGAESCDILVADVSSPSIGVGMEIMAAYSAGRRVIILVKKGNVTSRMLQHMDRKETVEFERDEDLYQKLRKII